jgi:hypothetical protein
MGTAKKLGIFELLFCTDIGNINKTWMDGRQKLFKLFKIYYCIRFCAEVYELKAIIKASSNINEFKRIRF